MGSSKNVPASGKGVKMKVLGILLVLFVVFGIFYFFGGGSAILQGSIGNKPLDLAVKSIDVVSKAVGSSAKYKEDYFRFTVNFANTGVSTATPIDWKVFLNPDSVNSVDYTGSLALKAIPASYRSYAFEIPRKTVCVYSATETVTVQSITATVKVILDSDNKISEANESNNAFVANVECLSNASVGGSVAVASNTPPSDQIMAGSQNVEVVKFKISADQGKDIYLKKFEVKLDADKNDPAISKASLYGSTDFSSSGGDVLGTSSLYANGANPGYFTWNFTGTKMPSIPANGNYYLTVKADFVSSSQAKVSGLTPKFIYTNAEFVGTASGSKIIPNLISDAGNVMQVVNTKPLITPDNSSSSGYLSASTGMLLAKINVNVPLNNADPSENKVTLKKIRLTVDFVNVTASHLRLYPANKDLNSIYAIKGIHLTDSLAEFDLSANANWKNEGYESIIEGLQRQYVLRGDVTNGANGVLNIKIAKLGVGPDSVYGINGDVLWSDDVNDFAWIWKFTSEVSLGTLSFPSAMGTSSGKPED